MRSELATSRAALRQRYACCSGKRSVVAASAPGPESSSTDNVVSRRSQAKIDRIFARVREAEWPDRLDAPIEPAFSKDQVLTNIMIYLVTNTIATSFWMYRARIDEPDVVGMVTVPTGKASLPRDNPGADPPRNVLKRSYNLAHYTKLPRGGHFAFWEQPELMVADVRQFFQIAKLRMARLPIPCPS